MNKPRPLPPERNDVATAAGITTISLSALLLAGGFGLWLLLILVMLVVAVCTCGLGLYAFPVGAIMTGVLHFLSSLVGGALATLGIWSAWHSEYRGTMTAKAIACLLGHLIIASLSGWLVVWLATNNPDAVEWLKSIYRPG